MYLQQTPFWKFEVGQNGKICRFEKVLKIRAIFFLSKRIQDISIFLSRFFSWSIRILGEGNISIIWNRDFFFLVKMQILRQNRKISSQLRASKVRPCKSCVTREKERERGGKSSRLIIHEFIIKTLSSVIAFESGYLLGILEKRKVLPRRLFHHLLN